MANCDVCGLSGDVCNGKHDGEGLPRRRHDVKALREALSRLVDGVWRGGKQMPRPCFSIPADVERDADLMLAAALTEIEALREVANAAKVHYEDGPSPPTWIALGDALRTYAAFKPGAKAPLVDGEPR